MSDQDLEVIEAMETYGGGFVKALAECFRHADAINIEKLKITFADYWEKYKEMSVKSKIKSEKKADV